MFELTGRVALVTGGARGMGRECALTLARQGARVVAADVNAEGLEQTSAIARDAGLSVLTQRLDVTSPDDWAKAVAFVEKQFNKLDILVNAAGIMDSRSFFDATPESFRRIMQVNVESMFIGMKAAYPLLLEGAKANPAGASVINFSSTYGQLAGPFNVAYCASKAAVINLTKAAAVDLAQARSGIRVNAILPGAVDTVMLRTSLQAFVDKGAAPNLAAVDTMVDSMIPMGRMAKVDDIAEVVAFLASDASRYMTGAEVSVDGGYSIV